MGFDLPPDGRGRRTFRDPAGSVELRADAVYRYLQPAFAAEVLEFAESPLAARLVEEGRLIGSEVLSAEAAAGLDGTLAEGARVLRHPRVPFVSYPWEWCPAQWMAAAELTLELNRELLRHGWILKDATPLNVLFLGARPVFVDVASVARADPTQPIWFAYSQFVRTFLLPMLAHSALGWPLRAALLRRDGLEPEELYAALPVGERLRQPALSAVTLPALLSKRRPGSGRAMAVAERRSSTDPELVLHLLQGTTAKLLKQMRRAMPKTAASAWSGYAGTATHYSEADHAAKREFVTRALEAARPRRVLDVGANAGVYSELAAAVGAEVVAVDTDLPTLDRLYRRLQGTGKNILPLVVDLANPTPGTGWRNGECASFLERAVGHFDGLVMLAVIHHLLLHDHIPLPAVAELASSLTSRTLIIEWVPATDSMFQELVRGREAIFAGLTEEAFRRSFGEYFRVAAERTLENGRVLFHLERGPVGSAVS